MSNNFDYYYGNEAEQFSFLRVPKLLIKDERFKGLSSDAKLLYGLMLDRMSLSMKNGWFDDQNRAYIHYTLENIMEDLGCAKEKCINVLAELDDKKGLGLIEKHRQGLGKPDIIYVKNFILTPKEKKSQDNEKKPSNTDISTEVRKSNFKKSENRTSASSEIELQEVRKSNPNNTNNINNTDISDNNLILSIYPDTNKQEQDELMDKDKIDEINANSYIQLIKENINYDTYIQWDDYTDKEIFEELFQLICEIVCVKRDTIRIGGYEYPYELVRARFLKLKSSHLQYVIDCIKNTPNKIKNVKAYMVASLYNAPTTMNTYFENWVNTDMMDGRV